MQGKWFVSDVPVPSYIDYPLQGLVGSLQNEYLDFTSQTRKLHGKTVVSQASIGCLKGKRPYSDHHHDDRGIRGFTARGQHAFQDRVLLSGAPRCATRPSCSVTGRGRSRSSIAGVIPAAVGALAGADGRRLGGGLLGRRGARGGRRVRGRL